MLNLNIFTVFAINEITINAARLKFTIISKIQVSQGREMKINFKWKEEINPLKTMY